jgi:hypothetical protein
MVRESQSHAKTLANEEIPTKCPTGGALDDEAEAFALLLFDPENGLDVAGCQFESVSGL